MKNFELFKDRQGLLYIFYKIVHKYLEEFDTLNSILEYNNLYITLISKNAKVFKNLEKDFPEIIIKHKFADLTLLNENNACYDYIILKDTTDIILTNTVFLNIFNEYIEKTNNIYKIDDTAFIILTDNIEIIAEILDKVSDLFNYNYIGNRHIFTLK